MTFCIVLLSACAMSEPWPAHYLSTGPDRATQDEVMAQLGPPYETHSLPDGGTEWHYHHRRGRPMIGLHGTMGVPPRVNAKNTFSDLITPVSCEAGINLWNGLVNHRRNTTHLMDWPRAVEDMRHG